MKLGFVVASLNTGGAERHTVQLANGLNKMGFDIVIYVLKDIDKLSFYIDKDIKVVKLSFDKYISVKGIKKLKKQLLKDQLDVLFCVNSYSIMLGYLSSLKLNHKIAGILHSTYLTTISEKFKNIYYKKIINKLDFRVFVSSNQKKHWVDKYKIKTKNSYVIKNGIIINRENNKEVCKGDKLIVVQCAMLRKEKNHEEMVTAISKLKKQYIEKIEVLFVGDGPERENIERLINAYSLQNVIRMVGLVEDVKPYLVKSHVGILTSEVETFSLAMLECMNEGLPVIMSNEGGANEMIIDGYNGFLYSLGNVEELSEIIEYCIDNKESLKLMGNNAKEIVKLSFGYEKMLNKYKNLIFEKVKEK